MVTCCDECGDGCDGGYPAAAWSWWQDTGIVTGDLFGDNSSCKPYSLAPCDHHTTGKYTPCPAVVPTPECTSQCNPSYSVAYAKDKHFASDSFNVDSNVAAIQTEIMTNGPVEAAFTVYEDFLQYKTGVYKHVTGGVLGGHAVKILGWGVESGTPYWLVANSWNEDWGNMGFFRIYRGSNECGIEDEITAGTPKL